MGGGWTDDAIDKGSREGNARKWGERPRVPFREPVARHAQLPQNVTADHENATERCFPGRARRALGCCCSPWTRRWRGGPASRSRTARLAARRPYALVRPGPDRHKPWQPTQPPSCAAPTRKVGTMQASGGLPHGACCSELNEAG